VSDWKNELDVTSHILSRAVSMIAIFRRPLGRTSWIHLVTLASVACGARQAVIPRTEAQPTPARVLPLARTVVLETSGPPPGDTSVTFTTGTPRIIILYHAGESITFARLVFGPGAFGDSGQTVEVDIRPRPGIYGLDLTTSLPLQQNRSSVIFEYARYFSAPARARQIYGSDFAFERALAVGRLLPQNVIELLPTTRPGADDVRAALPATGSYVVASPE
jgi:hypothetical protein